MFYIIINKSIYNYSIPNNQKRTTFTIREKKVPSISYMTKSNLKLYVTVAK
jgi:hypothetical protein